MASGWTPNLGEHDKPETHFMQGHQNHIYIPKERHISMGVNTKKLLLGTSLVSQIKDNGNLVSSLPVTHES